MTRVEWSSRPAVQTCTTLGITAVNHPRNDSHDETKKERESTAALPTTEPSRSEKPESKNNPYSEQKHTVEKPNPKHDLVNKSINLILLIFFVFSHLIRVYELRS